MNDMRASLRFDGPQTAIWRDFCVVVFANFFP